MERRLFVQLYKNTDWVYNHMIPIRTHWNVSVGITSYDDFEVEIKSNHGVVGGGFANFSVKINQTWPVFYPVSSEIKAHNLSYIL